MYEYRAFVRKVYDGDTVTVDIDLGFDVVLKGQKIRLLKINAPEVRGEQRLEGLKSRFVLSHEEEINRISSQLSQAIEDIESEGDETKIQKLKLQLGKLKSLDKISASMEGFVFAWDGHVYKLTGSFAPVNQIMSMLPDKYNRDNLNEEAQQKIVSIFPGKFKPPHTGHFQGAVEMIESYGQSIQYESDQLLREINELF